MHRFFLALTAFLGAAQVAHADSRFFCSADDKAVRFTVESGFKAEPGHELNHFRGALIFKNETAPKPFGRITLDSDSLTNRWLHGGELRVEVLYDGGKAAGGQTVNLAISAEQPDGATAFSGVYDLAVDGGDEPVVLSGKVSCGSK
ncbi:hypothetical protein [Rhizobium sp. 18055]|uniref:hypothetical protein n=1 Tax=Rhizobium sp. 18055 TaxID=2681403 RepID=UPI001359159B|nr:hypothetical protein [Rhizobium sp. 18055]